MNRQGSDPHFDRIDRIEMGDQVVRRNADETGGQAALRHKGLRRIGTQDFDLIGDLDVLRQVEIVKPVFTGQSGDNWVAEIGQARQNRIESMCRQVCADRVGVSDIEVQGCDSRETEILDKPLGSVEADVTERDFVVPAF